MRKNQTRKGKKGGGFREGACTFFEDCEPRHSARKKRTQGGGTGGPLPKKTNNKSRARKGGKEWCGKGINEVKGLL